MGKQPGKKIVTSKHKLRTIWIMLFILFLAAQGYLAIGPGGILTTHSPVEAFRAFFATSFADPLLTAGLVDFVVVAVVALVWMIRDLPAGQRWGLKTWLWILSFCIFPGLGVFVYFLWLNPKHRLVARDDDHPRLLS